MVAARPSLSWVRVTLDCADAEALAAFYCNLFGWAVNARNGAGWVQVQDPSGGVGLNFQADEQYEPPVWPEEPGKQAKMMHFEVLVDDVDAAATAAVRAGGREAPNQPSDRDAARLRVMLDPAGHPFCLFLEGE
jgi:predicted enzyme related to lactoylglutathione lyase